MLWPVIFSVRWLTYHDHCHLKTRSGALEPMSFRFLQTGDWQLGMTRHYFSEGAQERYSQARFDAIRTLARIAMQEQCQFMLVCGDLFESNQVDRKTVARTMEALKEVPVPVYILPGNHDPLDAATVYNSSTFVERKPENVHVIKDSSSIEPVEGLELVGAPWMSKRPASNPVVEVIEAIPAVTNKPRILAAHGVIDAFTPDKEAPGTISATELESVIGDGLLHFIAIGDRHSVTSIGDTGRAWYAGTPEATDFNELRSGFTLVVDIDGKTATAREVPVGKWKFIRESVNLDSQDDVKSFGDWLETLKNKDSTVLKLDLVGSISLTENGALEEHIAAARDVFAAIIVEDHDLLVLPDDTDFADMGFSGFAGRTVDRLRDSISAEGDEASAAKDALMLVLRLSGSDR